MVHLLWDGGMMHTIIESRIENPRDLATKEGLDLLSLYKPTHFLLDNSHHVILISYPIISSNLVTILIRSNHVNKNHLMCKQSFF